MPPNRFESEVESFLEGSHGDRTHIKRADHHTVTPLCGTLLLPLGCVGSKCPRLDLFREAVHPIRRHYTPSDRVQRDGSGVVLHGLGLSHAGVADASEATRVQACYR